VEAFQFTLKLVPVSFVIVTFEGTVGAVLSVKVVPFTGEDCKDALLAISFAKTVIA